MSIQREARRDAKEFVRAQMFYGEGAGTRRKLISATVDGKTKKSDAYAKAFHDALNRQDMAEHAIKARHEREIKDAGKALSRNIRGIVTGNYRAVNTSVLVVGGLIYIGYRMEVDKKAINAWNNFQADRKRKKRYPAEDFPPPVNIRRAK